MLRLLMVNQTLWLHRQGNDWREQTFFPRRQILRTVTRETTGRRLARYHQIHLATSAALGPALVAGMFVGSLIRIRRLVTVKNMSLVVCLDKDV